MTTPKTPMPHRRHRRRAGAVLVGVLGAAVAVVAVATPEVQRAGEPSATGTPRAAISSGSSRPSDAANGTARSFVTATASSARPTPAKDHPTSDPAPATPPARRSPHPRAVAVRTAVRLPHRMHGRAAAKALGSEVPVVARRARLTTAQLRQTLRTDPTMWVSKRGRLYTVDPAPAHAATRSFAQASGAAPPAADFSGDAFALHSDPGAPVEIYLDFTGAEVDDTAWNTEQGLPPTSVPAWDPAGDGGATFSAEESSAIHEIWQRVSADYAPFDVDVTTEYGGADALHADGPDDPTYGTTVLITSDTAEWDTLCHQTCGGIANVGALGQVDPEGRLDDAWIFGAGLGESPESIAEAAAHEAGHTFGLTHQGDQPNDLTSYDLGHHLWAPIMGAGYYHAVTQWAEGEYAGANNQQDELAQIEKVAPLRADEAGATPATATAVPSGTAYITDQTDTDVFALGTCAGSVALSASPAAVGADLDLHLTVVDSTGATIADVDPADNESTVAAPVGWAPNTTEQVASGLGADATFDGGTGTAPYFLEVRDGGGEAGGAGDPTADFDTYGSLGAYTVAVQGCSDPATAPSAPIRLRGGVTAAGLSASWQAPSNDGASSISGYQVSVDGGAWNDVTATSYADATITSGAHTVAVRAVNGVGAGPGTSADVQSATTPGAPQLYGTPQVIPSCDFAPDLQCLSFYFTAPTADGGSPITQFDFTVDGVDLGPIPYQGSNVIYGEAVNLEPGYPSDIRITAVNALGAGAPLAFSGLIPGPPEAIMTGFTASTDRVARTVTLTWPTPFDGGAPIQGYKLWYGTYPTPGVAPDAVTTGHSWTFQNVKYPGKQVWVAAYNSYGTTPGPGSTSFDMPVRSPLPGQVTGLGAVAHPGTGSVDVDWNPMQIDAPDAVVGYDVCVTDPSSPPGSAPPADVDAVDGGDTGDMDLCGDGTKATWTTTTSATVSGLTAGNMYIVAVQAVNPGGPGALTTQLLVENAAPGPVSDLTVTSELPDAASPSITATWSPPADLGGATGVDHYEARLDSATGEGQWQPVYGETSFTWQTWNADLVAGGTYTVDVRADTTGVYSSSFTGATTSQTITVPTVVTPPPPPPTPGDVTDLVATADPVEGTVAVTWSPPVDNDTDPITSYEVMIDGDGWESGSGLRHTFENVAAGPHTVTVEADNKDSMHSLTTGTVTMPTRATAPGAATALKVAPDAAHGAATVTWQPPADSGGSPVTGYVVTLGSQQRTVAASLRALRFTGLRLGTSYAATVAATNAVGQGAAARTSVLLRTAPGAPQVRVAPGAPKGPLTLTVTWKPGATNGATLTSYQVRVETLNAKGKVTHTATYSAKASARSLAPTLKAGTYKVSVRADNAVGWGAFSAWSKAVSPR